MLMVLSLIVYGCLLCVSVIFVVVVMESFVTGVLQVVGERTTSQPSCYR